VFVTVINKYKEERGMANINNYQQRTTIDSLNAIQESGNPAANVKSHNSQV
jgi:hypothetical protein